MFCHAGSFHGQDRTLETNVYHDLSKYTMLCELCHAKNVLQELQIRGSIEDNSNIIFFISQ